VSIPLEEDARLPILEVEIESTWRAHRKQYVKFLESCGTLKSQIRDTALSCVQVLQQCQNRGLNPDQGRDLIQELIYPQH
jgi:hypothetical protein